MNLDDSEVYCTLGGFRVSCPWYSTELRIPSGKWGRVVVLKLAGQLYERRLDTVRSASLRVSALALGRVAPRHGQNVLGGPARRQRGNSHPPASPDLLERAAKRPGSGEHGSIRALILSSRLTASPQTLPSPRPVRTALIRANSSEHAPLAQGRCSFRTLQLDLTQREPEAD